MIDDEIHDLRTLLNRLRRSPRLYPFFMSWVDRWPWLRGQLRDWVENRAAPTPEPAGQWPDWHECFQQQPLPNVDLDVLRFWHAGYVGLLSKPPVPAMDRLSRRQLLVDVSDLVRFDLQTGIQRVVRNILKPWLLSSDVNWHVEPVFEVQGRYYYARRFTCQWLNIERTEAMKQELSDHLVSVKAGDVFVGLDWSMPMLRRAEPLLQQWRELGVSMRFVVYDLLPLTLPQFYPKDFAAEMDDWLLRLARLGDELWCISATVAEQVEQRLQQHRVSAPSICHFPMGYDTSQVCAQRPADISLPNSAAVVLMVGTIDPRKGHLAVLDAVETLWQQGVEMTLVVIGRPASRVEPVIARLKQLQQHDVPGQQLLWQDNCDDGGLEWWYQRAQWLLAASEGEGYGLPILEAAQRGVPVLARDIPVFREVAPAGTQFFAGDQQLVEAIQGCLQCQPSRRPECINTTWADCAEFLLKRLSL